MPLKDRYALFCKRTTLHGFSEFYESASKWQKVFWIFVILGSAAMLILFIKIQSCQYFNGLTGTRITRLDTPDPRDRFPRIMVFDNQWSWIDFSKLERYNISREEVQVAMGYMVPGMVHDGNVSVNVAKERLWKKMLGLGVSTILKLYRLISLDVFDGTENKDLIYDQRFLRNETYYLLSTASAWKAAYAEAWLFDFGFDYPTYWKNAKAFFAFLEGINKSDEEIKSHRANLFNLDTYMYVALEPGYRLHIISDSNIFRPLGTCTKEHSVQELYFVSPCRLDCQVQANISVDAVSCFLYDKTDNTTIELTETFMHGRLNICHPGILNMQTGEVEGMEVPVFRALGDKEMENRDKEVAACQEKCLPRCEHWITTWSISTYRDTPGSEISPVRFIFPDPKVLVVLEDVQTYQWHDLVSDFGGLLGLWLGASMMSLVQLVHLCLFPREKK